MLDESSKKKKKTENRKEIKVSILWKIKNSFKISLLLHPFFS